MRRVSNDFAICIRHSVWRTQSAMSFSHSTFRNPKSEMFFPHSAIRNPKSEMFFPHSAIRNPKSEIKSLFFLSVVFLFLTFHFLLSPSNLFAQTPEWVYQHDSPYPNAIAVDSFGNTYTTGCIARNDTNGLGVIALDNGGNLKWLYFNDTLGDWAYGNDIIFNSAKIYVAGYVQFANGNKDLIVSCVDTAGQAQWIYRDTVS
ncbi:MAG: hypothetical protein ABIL44_09575, partial [candidate division WOR-3 bacterium]